MLASHKLFYHGKKDFYSIFYSINHSLNKFSLLPWQFHRHIDLIIGFIYLGLANWLWTQDAVRSSAHIMSARWRKEFTVISLIINPSGQISLSSQSTAKVKPFPFLKLQFFPCFFFSYWIGRPIWNIQCILNILWYGQIFTNLFGFIENLHTFFPEAFKWKRISIYKPVHLR